MPWLPAIYICLGLYLPYLGQSSEIRAEIQCVGGADIFVDGNFVGSTPDFWTGNISGSSRHVAVRCENRLPDAGLGAFFQYLTAENASIDNWKCGHEQAGWYEPAFNDSHWNAARVHQGPPERLRRLPTYAQYMWNGELNSTVSYCRKRLDVFVFMMVDGGGRVSINGRFKAGLRYGESQGFLMPWTTRVMAVETVSSRQGLSGISTSFSNGFHNRVSWKCTNISYSDWESVGYDDSQWDNATDYELLDVGSGLKTVWQGEREKRVYCRGRIECGCEHLCQVHDNGEDFHCLCPTEFAEQDDYWVPCPDPFSVGTDRTLTEEPSMTDTIEGEISTSPRELVSTENGLLSSTDVLDNLVEIESTVEPGQMSTGIPGWTDTEHRLLPSTSNFNVTEALDQLVKIDITALNVKEVASDLAELTGDPESLQDIDVVLASRVIQDISELNQPSGKAGHSVVRAANNLLQVERQRLQEAERTNNAASRIVTALEKYSLTADLEGGTSLQIMQGDIAMQIWDLPRMDGNIVGFGIENGVEQNVTNFKSMQNIDYSEIETAIIMSEEVQQRVTKAYNELKPRPEHIRLAFCLYRKPGLFVSPGQADSALRTIVNSEIVAFKVAHVSIEDLTDPIRTIFKPLQDFDAQATCVFWDFNANNGKGKWSREGCTYDGTVSGRVRCLCNHLTNFAILMDISQESMGEEHKTALTVITNIGLGLSILGLIATILTYLLFRKKLLWRNCQKVLVNLAVALLCVNIIFLAGIEQTSNKNVCIAVAALLHYFLLVAFAWMLVEAVLHYLRLVKVIGSYVERFMLKTSLPAWFIPGIPIAIIACTDPEQYRGPLEYCWLKKTTLYFAFMLPVGVIVLINAVLYICIIKSITCDRPGDLRSTQSKSDLTKLQLCSSVCIFILLGLTWAFGFLAIAEARMVFQYIFCILNTLQGFLIFLCHTLREKKMRDAWRKLFFRGKRGVQNVLETRNMRENHKNQNFLLLVNSSSESLPKTQSETVNVTM